VLSLVLCLSSVCKALWLQVHSDLRHCYRTAWFLFYSLWRNRQKL